MKNYNSHLWILFLMQVTCAYADNVIQVKIVGAAKIGLEKEQEKKIIFMSFIFARRKKLLNFTILAVPAAMTL